MKIIVSRQELKTALHFASTYDCDLSWSLKQTLGVSHQIEDPAQTKLPPVAAPLMDVVAKHGVTMTLKTGDKTVTITPEKAAAALKRVSKATAAQVATGTEPEEELIQQCIEVIRIEVIRSEQKASVGRTGETSSQGAS